MTNKELILSIIEIQGKLTRYGIGVHENYHDILNEVITRLKTQDSCRPCEYCKHYKTREAQVDWGKKREQIHSCEKWDCEFEPIALEQETCKTCVYYHPDGYCRHSSLTIAEVEE